MTDTVRRRRLQVHAKLNYELLFR